MECGHVSALVASLLIVTSWWSTPADCEAINSYILDYQPVHFDHSLLQERHARFRRDTQDSHLTWSFKAYGRTFRLRLYPAESMFSTDHVLDVGSGPTKKVDTSVFYDGVLRDHPGSSAHLSIRPGRVSGHIRVPGDTTYHIEPARNHFQDPDFHTIIYPESKMNMDPFK